MGCSDCPYKGQTIVKTTGSRHAEVMVVGEAPGKDEVSHKPPTPFVGVTGKLLNKLLETVNLSRESICISNAVRCQLDKKHQDTVKAAVNCCKEYLIRAIEDVKPKLIICLGDIAARQVLGSKFNKILSNHGTFHDSEYGKVFVTVHPSYVLRGATKEYPYIPIGQMNMKERMIFLDFQLVKDYMDRDFALPAQEGIDTSGYKRANASALRKVLKASGVAMDYEATSADVHSPDFELISCSFTIKSGESWVWMANDKKLRPLVEEILKSNIDKYLAARPFEDEVTQKVFGFPLGGRKFDIFTMAHVLDENFHVYNLETITGSYNPKLRKIKALAEGKRGNLKELPEPKLIAYNGVDTDATFQDFMIMKEGYNSDEKLRRYYTHFITPVQDMYADICWNGCKIDQPRLRENELLLEGIRSEAGLAALEEIPLSIRETYGDPQNIELLNKARLLVEFLFTSRKGLGLKPERYTGKTKAISTAEEHLKMFSNNQFIRKLFRYKKATKITSTYTKQIWDYIAPDGYVYPSTLLTRQVTGRMSTVGPAIGIFPKRGEFVPYIRSVFMAEDGWLLGERDASQSEMRIAGWFAQDKNILTALAKHIDLHTKTAALVNKIKIILVTDDQRQKAKAVNFGFIFGQSAEGFQVYAYDEYDIEFTIEECYAFRESFFGRPDGYYMLPALHERLIGEARKNGFVQHPLGRKRRLPAISSSNYAERSEAERQAINSPVQGFSSDLNAIGKYLFWKELKSSPRLYKYIKPMWFIHDATIFKAREDYMEKAHTLLADCIENRSKEYVKKYFKVNVGYPVESEGKSGPRWSEMRKPK